MKKNEIQVGQHYRAKVNNRIVTVRVDAVNVIDGFGKERSRTSYSVTNLLTGRKIVFRSAVKFRQRVEVNGKPTTGPVVTAGLPAVGPHGEETDPLRPDQDWEGDKRPLEEGEVEELMGPELAASRSRLEEENCSDPTSVSDSIRDLPAENVCVKHVSLGEKRSEDAPTIFSGKSGIGSDQSLIYSTNLLSSKIATVSTIQDTAPHLIVEARAGTGKTTTLVEGLKRVKGIPSTLTPSPQQEAIWESMALSAENAKTICFVAFNKSIATELQARVPAGCDAMTMHSLGYKAVMKALGRQQPDQYVVQDHIASLLGQDIRDLRRQPGMITLLKSAEELVSLCKMNLTDPTTENLQQLTSHYDVDLNGSRDRIFALVPQVLELCKAPKGKISFDDMIWLPIILNLPITQYDLLLVDEAQDLSRCQQALAKKAGRRLVLCGDPKQAIYGFCGADSESMSRMAFELSGEASCLWPDTKRHGLHEFDANGVCINETCNRSRPSEGRGVIVLPLTVTRRCGKAIVAEAQRYVPDFSAHETNGEGQVSRSPYGEKGKPEVGRTYHEKVLDGDMILCRVNAPLVSQCFRFIRMGKKAQIQGRDIGAGLISTVKKLAAGESVSVLVGKISDWLSKERSKELAKRNPSETKIQSLEDRHDCLLCFTEGADTVSQVIAKIESVFTDDKKSPGIKLSSIHKAKGLESKRVFYLRPPGTGPHEDKMKDWELDQENNLRYVAITRAISELVYVG